MTVINTDISSLIALNNLRINDLAFSTALERLSSGLRINHASDDPSGLAIATGMEAQIGGINQAVSNSEDGISLLNTADGALSQTQEMLLRMRDLSVRASNEATLTTADNQRLQNEFASLASEIDRQSKAITFNGKNLFDGTFQNGQILQVGPDATPANRITIQISQIDSNKLGIAPGAASLSSPSKALIAISAVNNALNQVSDVRSSLGIQSRRLGYVINDLQVMNVNLSAAKSRITDADMAETISEFTRLQVMRQVGIAVLAQANSQRKSILTLLSA